MEEDRQPLEVEKILQLIKNSEICLSNDSNVEECIEVLRETRSCIHDSPDSFDKLHARVFTFLLDHLNSKWFNSLSATQEHELFDGIFMGTAHEGVVLTLTRYAVNSSPSRKLEKALTLLENYLRSDALKATFLRQCATIEDSTRKELRYDVWDEFIACLVTLPDRVANKVQLKRIQNVFQSQNYFLIIIHALLGSLEQVYGQLQESKSCSLEFASKLIGRSCISGHSDIVIPMLIKQLSLKTSSDFLWRRITQRLFAHVPDNCLEHVITSVMKTSPWYKTVSHILGNAIQENAKLNYLLTYKLLLVRCFSDTLILNNILGYIANDDSRRDLLLKTLMSLLDVWGNKSSLRHRPISQHIYITKAVIICVAHLNADERKLHGQGLLVKMSSGVTAHLAAPSSDFQKISMVTARLISKTVDPDGPAFNFEYEKDDLVEELENLIHIPKDPGMELIQSPLSNMALKDDGKVNGAENIPNDPASNSEDLDSDDDLAPYDMSNDTVVSKIAKPYYLRDCMEGLIDREDNERIRVCLETATKLIRSDPLGLSDVAVEMTKILLHLEDAPCIPNFITLRMDALTALAGQKPQKVAQYLCEQFYDHSYNIAQRLDVLKALVAAAQELSAPTSDRATKTVDSSQTLVQSLGNLPTMENWREIVQQRIESKTRRFSKGRSRPEPAEVANRFAPVAGSFFFPLVRFYDRRENTLDLLGTDFFLLARLIYSLGTILYAALHAPIAVQMAEVLLEFTWAIRYHTEPYVRRSLVFALCMIVVSVPAPILTGSMQDSLIESQKWLQDILARDTDEQCLQLAAQALSLIEAAVKGQSI